MTVGELCNRLELKALALPKPERKIEAGYAGDLLSWVMGNAPHGSAWLTIMTNRNIIAVAELLELACIIVCEGCPVEEDVLALAREQEVNLLVSGESVFSACGQISALL